ncbi:MAG TPA: hypothetical protein VFQ45_19960 [Longimicrobium sp.]|nr:hypothetical protein [Longimicrobium sp.]
MASWDRDDMDRGWRGRGDWGDRARNLADRAGDAMRGGWERMEHGARGMMGRERHELPRDFDNRSMLGMGGGDPGRGNWGMNRGDVEDVRVVRGSWRGDRGPGQDVQYGSWRGAERGYDRDMNAGWRSLDVPDVHRHDGGREHTRETRYAWGGIDGAWSGSGGLSARGYDHGMRGGMDTGSAYGGGMSRGYATGLGDDPGYRGREMNRGMEYDRGYRSRQQVDEGDPFGDRAGGTPIRMVSRDRGTWGASERYDRGFAGGRYDRHFRSYGQDRDWF